MVEKKEFFQKPVNFISGFYIQDKTVCHDLVEFFKKNTDKQQVGKTGSFNSQEPTVDKDFKDSIDLPILPTDQYTEWAKYKLELSACVNAYVEKFPCLANLDEWNIIEQTNIQYYPPGGGFKKWHTERFSGAMPFSLRHLVFMTYLNDVTDGGETEFYHQELKIKPEAGLTVIWPADWTHFHRGIPSITQEKYIITGWFDFIPRK
jgi:hypothetical protein